MMEPQNATHFYFTIPDPVNCQFASSLEILTYLLQHDVFRREVLRAAHSLRVHSSDIVCIRHDELMDPFIITRRTIDEAFREEIDERLDREVGLLFRIAAIHPPLLRLVLDFQEFVSNELLSQPS